MPIAAVRPWIRSLALLLWTGTVGASPSFDCNKASTEVERTICKDNALGDLDASLAHAIAAALAANPGDRHDLIADQRRWLKERDRSCVASGASANPALAACLTDRYQDRIAAIGSGGWKRQAQPASALNCQKIVDRYTPLSGSHPGEPAIDVLSKASGMGVSAQEDQHQFINDKQLVDWGRQQKPAVIFPAELLKSFMHTGTLSMGKASFQNLPGTPLYSISSVQGTAHCYSADFFLVRNGRAEPVVQPVEMNDGICGNEPEFGALDGSPVLFIYDYDWTPSMRSSVTIVPWSGDHFGTSCTANFTHAPDFSSQTLNNWDEHCTGPDCETLKHEAMKLVAAAESDPRALMQQARSKLTATQLQAWQQATGPDAAKPAVPNDTATGNNPTDSSDFTDSSPLRVPFVLHDRLYDVALGHFTLGWRTFGDWGASFKLVDKDKLVDTASFAAGMRKGKVTESSPPLSGSVPTLPAKTH